MTKKSKSREPENQQTTPDISAVLLDECPFPIFRVLDGGKVMLPNSEAREAAGLLTKNNEKLTAKPARMAAAKTSTS